LLTGTISGYYSWKQSQAEVQAWSQSILEDNNNQTIDNQIDNSHPPSNNNPSESSQGDDTDNSTPEPDKPADIPTNENNGEDSSSGGDSSNQTPWGQGPSDQ